MSTEMPKDFKDYSINEILAAIIVEIQIIKVTMNIEENHSLFEEIYDSLEAKRLKGE